MKVAKAREDLTSLPAVSPSLKILSSFRFDYFHVFLKVSDVEPSLQHLLLFQKDLQRHKETVRSADLDPLPDCCPTSQCTCSLACFRTHGVGDVIGDSFAKHWSGQSGVDVFGVQVLVLAVEEQRGCVAAQQVGEGAPHHGEAEHGSILWVEIYQQSSNP